MAAKRIELEIAPRDIKGKATKRLRRAGFIPANIYSHKRAYQPVKLAALAFERLRRSHGTRHILALKLPKGSAQTALIRHVQHNAVTGEIVHVDFFRVNLEEQITVKVPLHFVGHAPAVKLEDGVVLHLLDNLEVRCKASDIVNSLDVDISSLTEIDATLHASDVKLPAGYALVTDADEPIIKIAAPRVEAAPVAVEAAAAPAAEAPAPAAERPAPNE